MTTETSESKPATSEDLRNLATKSDVGKFATKMDIASLLEELVKLRRELLRHPLGHSSESESCSWYALVLDHGRSLLLNPEGRGREM